MNINYHQDGNVVVAEMEGSLDTATSETAGTSLNQAIDDGANLLLLDLEKVDFISSAGLRILLGLAKRQMKSAGKLHLVAMNDTVQEVFTISGFDGIIGCSPVLEQGLDAIRS